MYGIFDNRTSIVTEIVTLNFKLKILKVKKIFGKVDEEEIARIEKRIDQLEKALLNVPPWKN